MHKSYGIVRYYQNYVVAYVDKGIVDYYNSLIPKSWDVQQQMYAPHITISRMGREEPGKVNWGYRDGERIEFYYDSYVYENSPYFYLKAYSESIDDIRGRLLLPRYRVPYDCHHITIGNRKHVLFAPGY